MSIWGRIKSFFTGRAEPPELPPSRDIGRPPRAARERPTRPVEGVDRTVPVSNPAWSSVQDYMDRNLTDRGVQAFDEQQLQLAALFDIVADAHQSDHIKRDAYEELEEHLAEFGFVFRGGINSVSDFDWGEFKNHYATVER